MRKAYPSTSYHIPSQGRQTSPSPQIGRRMSLLALHEERSFRPVTVSLARTGCGSYASNSPLYYPTR